jgi:hypothetical protein
VLGVQGGEDGVQVTTIYFDNLNDAIAMAHDFFKRHSKINGTQIVHNGRLYAYRRNGFFVDGLPLEAQAVSIRIEFADVLPLLWQESEKALSKLATDAEEAATKIHEFIGEKT